MKYLLDFLSTDPEAPKIQDGAFQQLLVDVHAGKSQSRSNDQFYESLEKIVNELRSAPEALIFLKPVSKKDAPDYAEVIKHPMDLSTVLRNVKAQKYKSKHAFGKDLDLIWENCLIYNAMEGHPLRATARYMKAKADHHLAYLQDRVDRGTSMAIQFPGLAGSPAPSTCIRAGSTAAGRGDGAVANGIDEDEDAAGEDEDGDVDMGDGALLQPGGSSATRNAVPTPVPFRDDRPDLTPNLEIYSSLTRTPASMVKYSTISLNRPGPSYAEKGKAREATAGSTVPGWYVGPDEDAAKAEGSWWGAMSKDEAYTGGLPAKSFMSTPMARPYKQIPNRLLRRKSLQSPDHSTIQNGTTAISSRGRTVHLERLVQKSVEELGTARRIANSIHDWQRIEAEGGALPPIERFDREQAMRKEEEAERKRDAKEEKRDASKRRRLGGEVGEKQAATECKRATAGMLAHAGFDGSNEGALDLFTRMATEHMRNMGRTFRLLLDGFSHKMSSEEIVLHALFENGLVRPSDLESHIKDDIEREGAKITEMTRKVKQAYTEVTTAPVIEDDMMFAEGAEMLTDGNFADELGEDFLGLRDLGVAKEHGMTNLTVPSNLFYGRKKRVADAAANGKADALDFTPPPPFIPLSLTTYQNHLPALLHAFFAARIEAGLGLEDSPNFETSHAVIGSLGQVSVKQPVVASGPKKKVVNGDGVGGEKKKPPKKPATAGVGKGNWIRPSKEEKARKEAAKMALLAAQAGLGIPPTVDGQVPPPIPASPAAGEEEDAEGEEE